MRNKTPITQELVRHLFRPCVDKKTLVWRDKWGRHKRNAADAVVGRIAKDGYLSVSLNNQGVLVHRLVWLYETGSWPSNQIDHINGDPADNRFENLRDVPATTNMQNLRGPISRNSTGFLGVCANGKYFKAKIVANGKRYYLGSFRSAAEAHEAYMHAKRKLHDGCTI